MTQGFKLCPACGSQADIATTACPRCGHVFSTQFTQPGQSSGPSQAYPSARSSAFTRSAVVYRRLTTQSSYDEVFNATLLALRDVGGYIQPFGQEIYIRDGTQGVDFAFTALVDARVAVIPVAANVYDVRCEIYARPASIFWICAIFGLCVILLWVVNVLFFVMNLSRPYQAALDRISLPDCLPVAPFVRY